MNNNLKDEYLSAAGKIAAVTLTVYQKGELQSLVKMLPAWR
jgi:hypothetical protein